MKAQGWLEKSSFFGLKLKRFCTLKGNLFSIFKDQECLKFDHSFSITQHTKIEILPDKPQKEFRISSSTESIHFYASSTEDMMKLVLALRQVTFTDDNLSMDHFRIVSVIGRGYYGKVMLCQNLETQELCN